jgi:hypothetical protein
LERKEKAADQLQSITKIKVKAFSCTSCPYALLEFVPPLCREAKHQYVQCTATKRFFKCSGMNQSFVFPLDFIMNPFLKNFHSAGCGNRATSLGSTAPSQACSKCGGSVWDRASMYMGKEVADKEALLVRGVERAFLTSDY